MASKTMIAPGGGCGGVAVMTPARMCECGDPEDYHRVVEESGRWKCVGLHVDEEGERVACRCTRFRPNDGKQGRML